MEINPCLACIKKYERTGCEINDLNNCCYETLAAFSGKDSVNSLTYNETLLNCRKCITDKLSTLGPFPNGYTVCDHRIEPPPIFVQVPHYFPKLFDGKNVEEAKQKCIKMCNTNTTYTNGCIENCLTDSDAIVLNDDNKEQTKETFKNDCGCSTKFFDTGNNWLSFILQLLILFLFLSMCYKLYLIFDTKKKDEY